MKQTKLTTLVVLLLLVMAPMVAAQDEEGEQFLDQRVADVIAECEDVRDQILNAEPTSKLVEAVESYEQCVTQVIASAILNGDLSAEAEGSEEAENGGMASIGNFTREAPLLLYETRVQVTIPSGYQLGDSIYVAVQEYYIVELYVTGNGDMQYFVLNISGARSRVLTIDELPFYIWFDNTRNIMEGGYISNFPINR